MYWSSKLRMKSPFGAGAPVFVLYTTTAARVFANSVSADTCLVARKNQKLSLWIGPPIAPLKFWMCMVPLPLWTFWLLRYGVRVGGAAVVQLRTGHVMAPAPPRNTDPLTMLPPSFGTEFTRMPPEAFSAVCALVVTETSAFSASL